MHVSFALDFMTRLVHGMRPLWIEAGNSETALLGKRIQNATIKKPIFISGMARAGSTLLLEFLAAHEKVATHQYRDFPFIFTPYFTRKFTSFFASNAKLQERAHGDGMYISPMSPEAMEEMLWLAFEKHPQDFAAFYRDHIAKLLLATGASRYATKNNNLLSRLPTLFELFPDARVIVPVRNPVTHIGSLMRQHSRFMEGANNPRAIRHLRALGHFEFGPTRSWQGADEAAGWSAAWNTHYRPLLPYLGKENILLVPFEGLCTAPQIWLDKIEQHAELAPITTFTRDIRLPSYYESGINAEDGQRITHLTQEIHSNLMKFVL